MSEAARLMMRFAFDTHDLHGLEATGLARNVGSSRMTKKAGVRRDGIFCSRYRK